jgi:hypothetical protein
MSIDTTLQLPANGKSLSRKLIDIFLPDGYPQCVTDDYTLYQIYVCCSPL